MSSSSAWKLRMPRMVGERDLRFLADDRLGAGRGLAAAGGDARPAAGASAMAIVFIMADAHSTERLNPR